MTPVPSDEAVLAAEKLERAWSTHGGYYPGARAYLAAAYAIDAPRIAAEAAAEARAATLRDMTGDEALNVATAAFENRIGTTHGVGDGMRAALAALAAHFNPKANDA